MRKKYELTKETRTIGSVTLHRIKALRSFGNVEAGELGGFIEGDQNLSYEDNAWVYDNAMVCGDARVYGDAKVCDNARVYGAASINGRALIYGNAVICDHARVALDAKVGGNAVVRDNAVITYNALVVGNAKICEQALIQDNTYVNGNAVIGGWAVIQDNVTVAGNAAISGGRIEGLANICGDAEIKDNSDYVCIKGLGSLCRATTAFRDKKCGVAVKCSYFCGSLSNFEKEVIKTHGKNKLAKEYLALIELLKIHFEIE